MTIPDASSWKIRSSVAQCAPSKAKVETAQESSCLQKRQSARDETNPASDKAINAARCRPEISRSTGWQSARRGGKYDTMQSLGLVAGLDAHVLGRRDREVKLRGPGGLWSCKEGEKEGIGRNGAGAQVGMGLWESATCTGSPCRAASPPRQSRAS